MSRGTAVLGTDVLLWQLFIFFNALKLFGFFRVLNSFSFCSNFQFLDQVIFNGDAVL